MDELDDLFEPEDLAFMLFGIGGVILIIEDDDPVEEYFDGLWAGEIGIKV